MATPSSVSFVRGDTLRSLEATIKDAAGVVLNLTGGTARLQATSTDLPGITIDYAGVLSDAANGKARFDEPGNKITDANMGKVIKVQFRAQIKFTDSAAKIGYSEEFTLEIAKPVIG